MKPLLDLHLKNSLHLHIWWTLVLSLKDLLMVLQRWLFFITFSNINYFHQNLNQTDKCVIFFKQNLSSIDPRVRDIILNRTLTALGPDLSTLNAEGFKLWFQVYLPLFLPSIGPNTFEIIPRNISCKSYQEMWVTILISSFLYWPGGIGKIMSYIFWWFVGFDCLCSLKGCDNVFTNLSMRQTQEVLIFALDYLKGHSFSGNCENIILVCHHST